MFEYNGKFTKHLIQQGKASIDQRIASGDATLVVRIQLETAGDPRAEQLNARDNAAHAKQKQDQLKADA